MKISKHIHSCILLKNLEKTILIDPGNYTYENNGLDVSALSRLDFLLITHEHPDHVYFPLLKQLIKKFPDIHIISNTAVAKLLREQGISVDTLGNDFIKIAPIKHEKIFDFIPPSNSLFTLWNAFTDPGDSLSFTQTADILALPLQAPWGSTVWAVEVAEKVKPKIILPIHDWHWRDDIRIGIYNRLEEYFKKRGITFLKPETGVEFQI